MPNCRIINQLFSRILASSQFGSSSFLFAFLCILITPTLLQAAPDRQDAKYLEMAKSFDQKVRAKAEKAVWEKHILPHIIHDEMEKELDNFKKIVDKVLESKSATTFIAREFKKQGEKTTAGKNSAFIGRLKHVSDPYVDKQVEMQWKRYDYLYDYMYLKNAMKILVESLNGFYSGRPVWSKIIAQNTIVKKLYEKMNKKVYKYMNQTDEVLDIASDLDIKSPNAELRKKIISDAQGLLHESGHAIMQMPEKTIIPETEQKEQIQKYEDELDKEMKPMKRIEQLSDYLTELAFNEWNKKEHLKRMKAEPHEKQRVAMAATGGKPASTSGHKAVMKVNGTGHAAAAGPSVNAEGAAEEKKEE